MSTSLYVKNMVCPRCIKAVEDVLLDSKIPYLKVELGQVFLEEDLLESDLVSFSEQIQKLGFELLDSGKSSLISQIKTLIINQIHHSSKPLTVNFSTYLATELNYEYSHLSRLFSSVEGSTIEKFITRQRVERVKELLFYGELTLSEIAFKMDYSSASYLSSQFKKETGMTPSAFKKLRNPNRQSITDL